MMDFPSSPSLDLDLSDKWLTVWFNEPERRNPLTGERVAALMELSAALQDRRDIRGVTFRGQGGIFCAGGDLKSFQVINDGDNTREKIISLSRDAAQVFDALDQLPQFTIMVVEGAAMAGGFGIVCCGDYVFAQREAKFALSETRIGLVAAQIAPIVMRRLGRAVARRLLLTASPISGDATIEAGISDAVFTGPDDLEVSLSELKMTVNKTAPNALSVTKALIRDIPLLSRNDQIERAATDFADCLMSDEGKEGVASFLERRNPKWADSSNV